jgi:hypothetical protein
MDHATAPMAVARQSPALALRRNFQSRGERLTSRLMYRHSVPWFRLQTQAMHYIPVRLRFLPGKPGAILPENIGKVPVNFHAPAPAGHDRRIAPLAASGR